MPYGAYSVAVPTPCGTDGHTALVLTVVCAVRSYLIIVLILSRIIESYFILSLINPYSMTLAIS